MNTTGLSRVHRRLYDRIVAAFKRQEATILNLDLYDLEEMTDLVIMPSEIDELNSWGLINAKLIGAYKWEMSLPEQKEKQS